jgi:hypothetical protein
MERPNAEPWMLWLWDLHGQCRLFPRLADRVARYPDVAYLVMLVDQLAREFDRRASSADVMTLLALMFAGKKKE